MGKTFAVIGTWFNAHRKTVAAVVAPVVVVVDSAITGTAENWPVFIAAVLVALGVYAVPNTPPAAKS